MFRIRRMKKTRCSADTGQRRRKFPGYYPLFSNPETTTFDEQPASNDTTLSLSSPNRDNREATAPCSTSIKARIAFRISEV
jgi:hypothetical protein